METNLTSKSVALSTDNGQRNNYKEKLEIRKEQSACKIYFVMPAHNEERSAQPQLEAIKNYIDKLGYEYEVLVVNDGSVDSTVEEIKKFRAQMPIQLLNHSKNLGVGRAFRTGFENILNKISDNDIVITMDFDYTQNIRTVGLMIQKIQEGYEIVNGSIFTMGGMYIGVPLIRLILTIGCNLLYRVLFHIKGIHDYTGFFRAYKGSALLLTYEKFGDQMIESDGFACMAELLIKFRQIPLFITEVPMILRYDLKSSKSKIGIFKTIAEHLRIIRKNVFKRRVI